MKSFSRTTRKNIAVFFFGPLALFPAALLAILIMLLFGGAEEIVNTLYFTFYIPIIGLFVFAYPATLLIGIPAIIFLERNEKMGLMPLSLVGVLGAIIITVFSAPSLFVFALFCYCALAVCVGCWYVNKLLSKQSQSLDKSEIY